MSSQPAPFPRTARLLKPTEFNQVFRDATIRRQRGALRLSARANRMPSARLGLVVGKRSLARATERNRAKRVLRDTFRLRRAGLPAMDIVIQVTRDASNSAYRSAFEALLAELSES